MPANSENTDSLGPSSGISISNGTRIANDKAQESIHRILETVLRETLTLGTPTIALKKRLKGTRFFVNHASGALEAREMDEDAYRIYSFPGKDSYEAWRFSMLRSDVLLVTHDCLFTILTVF